MNSYSYSDSGVLTITNEEGWELGYAYNPETLIPFSSEEEAIAYADSRPMSFSKPMSEEEQQSIKEQQASNAIQQMLDASSATRGYDSIISECSYASSTSTFGEEAQLTVNWRDSVWTYVFQAQADIKAGDRTEPTLSELLDELPEREALVADALDIEEVSNI